MSTKNWNKSNRSSNIWAGWHYCMLGTTFWVSQCWLSNNNCLYKPNKSGYFIWSIVHYISFLLIYLLHSLVLYPHVSSPYISHLIQCKKGKLSHFRPNSVQYFLPVFTLTLWDISAITGSYTLINMYLFQFDYKKGQKTSFHTVPDRPIVHDIVFAAQSKIYIAVLGKKYISF